LHLPSVGVTRRGLFRAGAIVGGGTLAAVALGCSDEGEATVPTAAVPEHSLLAAFPQSTPHIAVGVPTRLPYLVSDREGVPLAAMTGPATFTVSKDGDVVVEDLEVQPRSEGVERAYLPLNITFPELGVYDVSALYEGDEISGNVQVYAVEEVGPPLVGQPLPPVVTPTVLLSQEVDPICTRVPQCPFHEVSLDTALAAGKPVVLLVASPAYCQTAICGPVLDNLMAIVGERDDISVIHAEVYRDPKSAPDLASAALAGLPEAYELDFEPVLYVTDAAGEVTARADVIVDSSEMADLIG
jgi:hypothetical protein